jgi:hypothetical protein
MQQLLIALMLMSAVPAYAATEFHSPEEFYQDYDIRLLQIKKVPPKDRPVYLKNWYKFILSIHSLEGELNDDTNFEIADAKAFFDFLKIHNFTLTPATCEQTWVSIFDLYHIAESRLYTCVVPTAGQACPRPGLAHFKDVMAAINCAYKPEDRDPSSTTKKTPAKNK